MPSLITSPTAPKKPNPTLLWGQKYNSKIDRAILVLIFAHILVFPLNNFSIAFAAPDTARWLLFLGMSIVLAVLCLVKLWLGGAGSVGPAGWLALAFGGTSIGALLLSVHPPTAWYGSYERLNGVLSLLAVFILCFSISQLSWDRQKIQWLGYTLAALAFALSAFAVIQFITGTGPSGPAQEARTVSTLDNPLTLAAYLVALFPLTVALFLQNKRWWSIILPLVVLAGLATTFARSAWLAGLLSMLVLAIGLAHRPIDRRRIMAFFACMAVVLSLVGIVSLKSESASANLPDRAASILTGATAIAERLEVWKSAAGAVVASPLIGYGQGTFRLVFPRYETARLAAMSGAGTVFDDAHNLWLQIALDTGLVGLIIFVALIITVIVTAGRHLRGEQSSDLFTFKLSLVAGFTGLLLTLTFGLLNLANLALLWLMLALIAFAPGTRRASMGPAAGIVSAIILSGLMVAIVWGLIGPVQTYPKYVASYALAIQGDKKESAALFSEAIARHPYYDDYYWAIGSIWTERFAALGDVEEARLAELAFKSAIGQNAYVVDNYAFLTDLYLTAGRKLGETKYYRLAERTAGKGLLLRPNSANFYQMLSAAYRGQAKTRDAVNARKRAAALGLSEPWMPRYPLSPTN